MPAPENSIYFGNLRKAQWVKAPVGGLGASSVGTSEQMDYANGGAFVSQSAGAHREFDFSWPTGQESDFRFLREYREGDNGTGLMYWVDPMATDVNALPPHVARPALSGQGWPSILGAGMEPVITPATYTGMPVEQATYTLSVPIGTVAQRKTVLIIAPEHTLWLGYTGSAVNGGVVRVQPVNLNGTYAAVQDLVLLNPAATTRLNISFSGATYSAVIIYLTQTATGTASITLNSAKAVYSLTGITPVLTGSHVKGFGHSGMRFSSGPTFAYIYYNEDAGKKYVSAAAKFTEVGSWI